MAKDNNCATFGKILLLQLSEEAVKSWLSINRGCFVLLNIAESHSGILQDQLKELLKPHAALLRKQKFNGAQLLVKQLF